MTNQTIFIGKKEGETEAEAQARIDAAMAEMQKALEQKAALLKKAGMR